MSCLPTCSQLARPGQAGGGEPLHRLGVGPDCLGGLALGGQAQSERADLSHQTRMDQIKDTGREVIAGDVMLPYLDVGCHAIDPAGIDVGRQNVAVRSGLVSQPVRHRRRFPSGNGRRRGCGAGAWR